MTRRLILASASPARRFLLESAGLKPEVMVSHVPEDGVDHLTPAQAVAELARRKGLAVAARLTPDPAPAPTSAGPSQLTPDPAPAAATPAMTPGAVVVACDSLLEFEGEAWGKAASAEEVISRWKRLRGATGQLHTGHFVFDTAGGRSAGETDTAVVHFGRPSDAEIAAYARTAESLQVAGPFTLEGRSAPWIDSIEGNYGTITGISLPVLRRLLARVGTDLLDLWA